MYTIQSLVMVTAQVVNSDEAWIALSLSLSLSSTRLQHSKIVKSVQNRRVCHRPGGESLRLVTIYDASSRIGRCSFRPWRLTSPTSTPTFLPAEAERRTRGIKHEKDSENSLSLSLSLFSSLSLSIYPLEVILFLRSLEFFTFSYISNWFCFALAFLFFFLSLPLRPFVLLTILPPASFYIAILLIIPLVKHEGLRSLATTIIPIIGV